MFTCTNVQTSMDDVLMPFNVLIIFASEFLIWKHFHPHQHVHIHDCSPTWWISWYEKKRMARTMSSHERWEKISLIRSCDEKMIQLFWAWQKGLVKCEKMHVKLIWHWICGLIDYNLITLGVNNWVIVWNVLKGRNFTYFFYSFSFQKFSLKSTKNILIIFISLKYARGAKNKRKLKKN